MKFDNLLGIDMIGKVRNQFDKVCPYCGSMKNHLLQGDEFNIKEIEVV